MNYIRKEIRRLDDPVNGSFGGFKQIFLFALWLGLVTGLGEGLLLWGFQKLNWLAWPLTTLGMSLEVLWVSTIFDLVIFCFAGLILGLIYHKFPYPVSLRLIIFALLFIFIFDWINVPLHARVPIYAIAVLALGITAQATRWFLERHDRVMHFCRASLPVLILGSVFVVIGIPVGSWLSEEIATSQLPVADQSSPNILVIVVDALRADHLASYGYSRVTSPNIDQLAKGGVLFEHAIASSSWTQPSHASLLTGRYTYEHGAELKPLDKRYPTIGKSLQASGYRTGGFSGNVLIFNRRKGFGRGFSHFEDYYSLPREWLIDSLYGRLFEVYGLHRIIGYSGEIGRKSAGEITDALLQWIDKDQKRPFFATINYFDVHDPYTPPLPYRSQYSRDPEAGGMIDTYWDDNHIYLSLTPEQVQSEIDGYDGGISYVDEQIGLLLEQLKQRGMDKNTMVVILSDHGKSFGEHGLFQHLNALYWEAIHVPFIIYWPGHVPAGLRVDRPVSITSLPASLLNLIGIDAGLFPSPPLTMLWKDPSIDWPDPVAELAQIPWSPPQNPSAHGAMKSVITPQWHYIVHEKFGAEIYDWNKDPRELNNLINQPDMQDTITQIRGYLDGLLANANN